MGRGSFDTVYQKNSQQRWVELQRTMQIVWKSKPQYNGWYVRGGTTLCCLSWCMCVYNWRVDVLYKVMHLVNIPSRALHSAKSGQPFACFLSPTLLYLRPQTAHFSALPECSGLRSSGTANSLHCLSVSGLLERWLWLNS